MPIKSHVIPPIPGRNRRAATFNLGKLKVGRKTPWAIPENIGTVGGWDAIAGIAPFGQDIIIDIEDRYGASIFKPGKAVVIPSGSLDLALGLASEDFKEPVIIESSHVKWFRAFALQIGTDAPGADVTVNLYFGG